MHRHRPSPSAAFAAAVATALLTAACAPADSGSSAPVAPAPSPTVQLQSGFSEYLSFQYWPGSGNPPPEPFLGPQVWPSPATTPVRAPSSALPETTTVSPEVSEQIEAVTLQVGVAERAFLTAVRSPGDAQLVAALDAATAPGSPARQELSTLYTELTEQGYRATAHPTVPSSVTIVGTPIISADGLLAFATVCSVNSDSLVADGQDGAPTVVDDSVAVDLLDETLLRTDSGWILYERKPRQQNEGESCATS